MKKTCPKGHEFDTDNNPYCVEPECLTFAVYEVRLPKDGGQLSFVRGHKYPLRGVPAGKLLDAAAATKRVFIATPRLAMKFWPLMLPLVFFPRRYVLHALEAWVEEIYLADYYKKKIPEIRLSQFCRELIRALRKVFGERRWIDCLVEILEHDTAYRFRTQDAFAVINRTWLRLRPRREILRVLRVCRAREHAIGAKWQLLYVLTAAALYASPLLVRKLKELLLELRPSEVEMNINDVYWVSRDFHYDYGGYTYEQRSAWRLKEDEDFVEPTEQPDEMKVQMNVKRDFFQLSRKDAEKVAENCREGLMKRYEEGK